MLSFVSIKDGNFCFTSVFVLKKNINSCVSSMKMHKKKMFCSFYFVMLHSHCENFPLLSLLSNFFFFCSALLYSSLYWTTSTAHLTSNALICIISIPFPFPFSILFCCILFYFSLLFHSLSPQYILFGIVLFYCLLFCYMLFFIPFHTVPYHPLWFVSFPSVSVLFHWSNSSPIFLFNFSLSYQVSPVWFTSLLHLLRSIQAYSALFH